MPIVSVLLPVRDGEAHLPEAIASIAGQTLDDFEVIAVDDGSRDATPEILRRWASEDGRVRVIHHPPQGIADALETARHAARGRYLARMDADDIAMPDRLARQLAAIEAEPSLVAVGSRIRYFPRGSLKSGARRYERWINALSTPDEIDRDLFVECPLPHPTFFLRASAVEAAGGYHDAGWPEDYDLLLRLWEAGGRFANVPEVLLRWREHPGRLSRTAAAYSPDAFRRCKARYLIHTLLLGETASSFGARVRPGRGSRERSETRGSTCEASSSSLRARSGSRSMVRRSSLRTASTTSGARSA